MSKNAAQCALKMAKLSIHDLQVIELHDCFSANELLTFVSLNWLVLVH